MPELAEVEFFRKRWQLGGAGEKIQAVTLHPQARIFRGVDLPLLQRALVGERLEKSSAAGKQMMFEFTGGCWLGIHLGMSGELTCKPANAPEEKHDHLVLRSKTHALVFNDPRMFGRVQFAEGKAPPLWWQKIAPAILSPQFTLAALRKFLTRRSRAPLKAVLLMQEHFPGIGNWMADEILWRAGIHPRQPAGSLTDAETKALWTECRRVCRMALTTIAGRGTHLPKELNVQIPRTWLFRQRWKSGGICPRTHQPLAYATIGGRTTCWSPNLQKLH